MRKLPAAERMFVCLMFHGAKNASDAVRKAGIPAKTDAALRTRAHRLMHSQKIAEAMLEEIRRRRKTMLPKFERAWCHDRRYPAPGPLQGRETRL
jgi:hypothetical protein